ncbi:MAG TPA: MFS transporter [Acidimicrobiales bacterium]
MTQPQPALAAFKHRDFSRFWIAALVSNSAAYMQFIAVPALLKERTGSNTWVGAAAMASMIPATMLTPFAGLLADRVSRRLILTLTQIGQMAVASAMFVLYVVDLLTPWRMMGLLLANGIVSGFQVAAWQSFVPTLVPRHALVDAVRLNSVQFQASRAIGPGIGALAVGLLGIGAAFLLNAVTYVPVILAVLMTRPRQLIVAREGRDIRADFIEGFRFTWGSTALRRAVLTSFVVSVLGQSLTQLAAGIATDVYGRDARANAGLVAAVGVGSLITGIWIIGWGGRVLRSNLAMWGLVGYVLGVTLTVVTTSYAVGVVAFFITGLSHIPIATSLNTFMQSAVPDEIRGRVVSFYLLGVMLGMPIGSFGLGRLSDSIGMREVLVLDAIAFAIYFVVVLVAFNRLREIDQDTIVSSVPAPKPALS